MRGIQGFCMVYSFAGDELVREFTVFSAHNLCKMSLTVVGKFDILYVKYANAA